VVLPEGAKLFVYGCADEEEEEEGNEEEEEEEVDSRRKCPRPPSCDPSSSSSFSSSPPLHCFRVSGEDLRTRVGGPLISSAVPGGTAVVEVVLPLSEEEEEEGEGEGERVSASSSSPRHQLELRVAAVLQSHEDASLPLPPSATEERLRLRLDGKNRRRRRRRKLSEAAAQQLEEEAQSPSPSASPSSPSSSSSLPEVGVSRTTYDLRKLLPSTGQRRRSCGDGGAGRKEGTAVAAKRQATPPPAPPPLASCFPSLLANASRGAVAIFAPLSRDLRALATCSGALVAAAGRRGRPLVLTADHCLRGTPSASPSPSPLSTLDLWTFAFGYGVAVERSSSGHNGGSSPSSSSLYLPCGSVRLPPPPQVVQGAALRWFSRGPDVALLELPGGVPASFQAYALGFDAVVDPPRVEVFSRGRGRGEEGDDDEGGGGGGGGNLSPLPASSLVAIHFPGGGPARASFVREVTAQFQGVDRAAWRGAGGSGGAGAGAGAGGGSSSSSSSSASLSSPPTTATHWRVRYFDGDGDERISSTSRGSSGAPLIDLSTGRIVAVLTGGSLNDGRGSSGGSSSSGSSSSSGCGGNSTSEKESSSSFDFFGTLSSAWRAGASSVLSPPPPPPSSSSRYSSSSSKLSLGGSPGFDPATLPSPDRGPRLGFSPSALLVPSSSSAAGLTAFLSRSLGPARALRVALSVAPIPSGEEAFVNDLTAAKEGVALFPSRGFTLTDTSPAASVEVRDAAPGRRLPVDGRRFYVVASARELSQSSSSHLPSSRSRAAASSSSGGGKGGGSGNDAGAAVGAGAASAADLESGFSVAIGGEPWRDELGMKVVVSSAPKAGYGDLLAQRGGKLGDSPPFDVSSPADFSNAGLAAFWWDEEKEKENDNETRGFAKNGDKNTNSSSSSLWDVSVCLLPALMPDAAVALYADGNLEALASGTDYSWRESRRRKEMRGGGASDDGSDGNGNGNSSTTNNNANSSSSSPSSCIDVAEAISFPAGARIDLVVSDSDFLNQALAARGVTRLRVVRSNSSSSSSSSSSKSDFSSSVPPSA